MGQNNGVVEAALVVVGNVPHPTFSPSVSHTLSARHLPLCHSRVQLLDFEQLLDLLVAICNFLVGAIGRSGGKEPLRDLRAAIPGMVVRVAGANVPHDDREVH